MRTIEDYKMNYCENICDNRLNENLRKHGKDHNSVINDTLRGLNFAVFAEYTKMGPTAKFNPREI